MWSNFFTAGGFGMYPTLVFGFLLLAAIGLHALRREARYERIVFAFAILTVASGVLGTAIGVCNTARFLEKVAAAEQLQVFALGIEESLHNLVLAMIIVILAGLVYIASSFRQRMTA